MSGKAMGLMGLTSALLAADPNFQVAKIPSHKIETKEEKQQLSKRRLQKLKGKKARKNRGNNR